MATLTLNGLAYAVLDSIRGQIIDDDNIDLREIKRQIHAYRGKLLKQKLDANPYTIDPAFSQVLKPSGSSVELELIDSSSVPTFPSGLYMLRTNIEIPLTVERRGFEGTFLKVGPADRFNERFQQISFLRAPYAGNGKFNKNIIHWFLFDNRIYLISKSNIYKQIRFLDIVAVFENPEEVWLLNNSNNNFFDYENGNYPITQGMANDIQKLIITEWLRIAGLAASDEINNAKHDEDKG